MLVQIELPKLSRIQAEFLYELRFTEDQERKVAEVGKIGSLVRVFSDHVFHKLLGVSVFFDALLLDSEHSEEGGDVSFERRVHFLEFPPVEIYFDDELVEEIEKHDDRQGK